MPKDLGTLINDAFKKAGVDANNEDLKAILTNPELSKIQIPDALVTPFEGNLHSIASAKPTVQAEIFNGIDTHVKRFAKEKLNMTDDQIADIYKDKNSAANIERLIGKALELEAQRVSEAHKGNGKKEADLVAEINKLKGDISTLTNQHNTALSAKDSEVNEFKKKMTVLNAIGAQNIIVPDGFTKEEILELNYNKYINKLSETGAQIVMENGRPVLKDKNGSDFFDKAQQKVDFKDDLAGFLSSNKQLKTADPNPPGDPNQQVIDPKNPASAGDKKFLADLEAQLKTVAPAVPA